MSTTAGVRMTINVNSPPEGETWLVKKQAHKLNVWLQNTCYLFYVAPLLFVYCTCILQFRHSDLPRQKRRRILTNEMLQFIEAEMRNDDELTSTKLKEKLEDKWKDVKVSKTTIKRERRNLGWVCTRPHYCQLLREVRTY